MPADYNAYVKNAGITNRQMVAELRRYYPKYGKPTQTMICNPSKYAVQLTPEAEAILRLAFGTHPGLSDSVWDGKTELPKPRRQEHRRKGNKLTVRLDDSLFDQLCAMYNRTAFASMQDMVEAAIVEFLNKRNENRSY